MIDRKFLPVGLLTIVFCAIPLYSTHTEFWRISSFKRFLQGNLQGVSVSMDGELTLAPETRAIFNPDETVALSVVAGRDGRLTLGRATREKFLSSTPTAMDDCFSRRRSRKFSRWPSVPTMPSMLAALRKERFIASPHRASPPSSTIPR